jgi:hypothetical protein
MDSFRRSLVAALVLLLSSTSAWAQATAQLGGTVRDESGAVLPGVTVVATQTDTGFTRTVVTEGSGAYVITNLPTGPYRLEVSLQGFRSYVQTGIVLQVGGSPTINPILAVGAVEESVTVDAAAPLVDVQSAGISEVVENERIAELPLQGRQVTDLIVLAGAAVNTGTVSGSRGMPGTVAISVAGGLRFGVAYQLDGAMHNNTYDNQNLPLPFPDALQEFSVATSGLSAQNGMHSGASVSAVTKSGTNRFTGNLFEFMRHHRFNSPEEFAAVGPDGKKASDGLVRNQFGGTLGGPIVNDRLFFFGAFQGAVVRQTPASNKAWVFTDAMLAGDFTALASPACNGGRQVALGAPFANNRVDPRLLSQAAVTVANRLPRATDPCGEINYSVPLDTNDWQAVGKIDYQRSADHSLFGRYMRTYEHRLSAMAKTGNILTASSNTNRRAWADSLTLGDTRVFGANMVNSFRVTWNKTKLRMNTDPPDTFFDAPSLGIKLHTYLPGLIGINVDNAFGISGGDSVRMLLDNEAYQVGNDLSVVRGRHQMAVGASVARWTSDTMNYARAIGQFIFNGRATGLSLADFLTGQQSRLRHAAPGQLPLNQWHVGLYAQDAWRASDRLTFNLGLRWEPYLGQNIENGAIANFSFDNFRGGVRSTVFVNAPPGLIYPGDPGAPEGQAGLNKQWWNLSPRVGMAWDVTGDGRTAIRSSYGIAYDFVSAQYLYMAGSSPPYSNRVEFDGRLRFEDPYAGVPGGETHPIPDIPTRDAVYPGFGAFSVIDPDINSTRVQSWNVILERQIGTVWQASASYLGSYTDRLWGGVHLNPGVFLGLAPCVLNGVTYTPCTQSGNLDRRRVASLENPAVGQFLGPIQRHADVGTQDYAGLRLSLRRRATTGVDISGNYTLSKCETDTEVSGSWLAFAAGYLDPNNPRHDWGNCGSSRTHIANLTLGAQTPQFTNAALRAVASDWRFSGIVNARSGTWMTVTTTTDVAATGIESQRVNQVLDNPYGDKSLTRYLDAAAFALPQTGTLGNHVRNSIEGPGYWTIDLAVTRLVSMADRRALELRLEVFNLLNNFNWGTPNTSFGAGTFGRITSQSGDPRIMQFGIKYGF